jgi:hypothetical protein
VPKQTEHTEELRNFSSGSIDLIDLASHEQRAAVAQSNFLVKDYFMSGANRHGELNDRKYAMLKSALAVAQG